MVRLHGFRNKLLISESELRIYYTFLCIHLKQQIYSFVVSIKLIFNYELQLYSRIKLRYV